jgi:hypothetical protein
MRAAGKGDELNDLLEVANSHYYGNGSVEGQYGRFLKVVEAKNNVPDRPQSRSAFGYTYVNPVGFKIGKNATNANYHINCIPSVGSLRDYPDMNTWLTNFNK